MQRDAFCEDSSSFLGMCDLKDFANTSHLQYVVFQGELSFF